MAGSLTKKYVPQNKDRCCTSCNTGTIETGKRPLLTKQQHQPPQQSFVDLSLLIHCYLFPFLCEQDPLGAPVAKETEAEVPVTELPKFSSKIEGHLASLRSLKNRPQLPFSPLENKLGSPLISNKLGSPLVSN